MRGLSWKGPEIYAENIGRDYFIALGKCKDCSEVQNLHDVGKTYGNLLRPLCFPHMGLQSASLSGNIFPVAGNIIRLPII